jgi:hypothetical protein
MRGRLSGGLFRERSRKYVWRVTTEVQPELFSVSCTPRTCLQAKTNPAQEQHYQHLLQTNQAWSNRRACQHSSPHQPESMRAAMVVVVVVMVVVFVAGAMVGRAKDGAYQ